jgi:hypothetical protein
MSPILIVLLFLYTFFGSAGLAAFVSAARRTNEDWDLHPSVRRMELALLQAEQQALREPQPTLPSRAG